jgi:hypothetical protein
MSWPTERFPLHAQSVGTREEHEGGDPGPVWFGGGVAVLDSRVYRDMRWCPNCGGEQMFLPVYEFEGGRVGVCFGCGDEKVAAFTRTTAEAA